MVLRHSRRAYLDPFCMPDPESDFPVIPSVQMQSICSDRPPSPPALHLSERPDAEHLQRPPAIPFRIPPTSATTVSSTSGYRLAERAKSGEYSFCRPWGRRRYLCDVQKTAAPPENGRPLFRSSGFRRCCCFLSHYVPLRLTQSRKACLRKDVSRRGGKAPHEAGFFTRPGHQPAIHH